MKRQYSELADSLSQGHWHHEATQDGSAKAEDIDTACLIDIMRSLRSINRLMQCRNFIDIPRSLRAIERNTAKPKRKRKDKR